jgi:hypothetical protein
MIKTKGQQVPLNNVRHVLIFSSWGDFKQVHSVLDYCPSCTTYFRPLVMRSCYPSMMDSTRPSWLWKGSLRWVVRSCLNPTPTLARVVMEGMAPASGHGSRVFATKGGYSGRQTYSKSREACSSILQSDRFGTSHGRQHEIYLWRNGGIRLLLHSPSSLSHNCKKMLNFTQTHHRCLNLPIHFFNEFIDIMLG